MSEEEKAIEILKETDLYNLGHDDRFEELRLYENALETVLNLISNLQKENEELHKEINQRIKLKLENEKNADDLYNKIKILQKELDKKDKVIDELIMLLLEFDIDEIYCAKIKDCFEVADGKCSDCIKQYFYKKAEGKDE